MLRPTCDRAISLASVIFISVAPIPAAIIFTGVVRPKLSAESPANRLTIVEAAIRNTSANAPEDVKEEHAENSAGDLASDEASRPTATAIYTIEDLEWTTSERLTISDTTTASAAKQALSTL